ncbi:MAG: hypothetical protein ABMB14_19935 [Myxococcota bacterium]
MRLDAVAIGVGLAGCSGSGSTGACVAGITLGTGVDAFTPLSDDDPLAIVYGPQGGYHLPLAVRGCGAVPDAVDSHLTGDDPDGRRVVDLTVAHGWVPVDDCCADALDLRGYLPDDAVDGLIGAEVSLRIEVVAVDGGGDVGADAVRVRVIDP